MQQELIFSEYLDILYLKKNPPIESVTDIKRQYQNIDLHIC